MIIFTNQNAHTIRHQLSTKFEIFQRSKSYHKWNLT